MWVWRGLGYEHVAQLPGSALGALGCRCREALADQSEQDWASTTHPSDLAAYQRQEALLDEKGRPLVLEDPESAEHGTRAGSISGAWRLAKHASQRLCVPGAVELKEGPPSSVEIVSVAGSGSPEVPSRKRVTVHDALNQLVQRGGGEFWYSAPQVVCHLRGDIADECCGRKAPADWPLCVVGAQIGAAMRLTVVADESPHDELGSPPSPASPSSPMPKATEVQCKGFRLRMAQRGGPLLDPAKLHEKDREGVANQLRHWAEKSLAAKPQTWCMLGAVVKPGMTDEPQHWRTSPSMKGMKSLGAPKGAGGTGPGAAFRGGRQLGDMVLAAASEAEVALDAFELSYGSAHVNSMRRMLEDEIATVLGVPALMVMCGSFSSSGHHGRPKQRHLPREVVTLEIALLCQELADIARKGPLLPQVRVIPLGTQNAQMLSIRQGDVKFKGSKSGKIRKLEKEDSMSHYLRQTLKNTEQLHETMMAMAQRRNKAKEFEESAKQSKTKLSAISDVQVGSLSKSHSDPGLLASSTKVGNSRMGTPSTKNRDMSPDQLLKLLVNTLQDASHPVRKHPDVFPMLSRIHAHGLHPGVVVVASRDAMKDVSKDNVRSSTVAVAESLHELLERRSPYRSREVDSDEIDAEAMSKLSTRRLDILEMYEGRDGDMAIRREELISASEKEMLDYMEASYPNQKSLKVVLQTIGDRAANSQNCCLRLRHHRAVERLTYTMNRFNSDYSIVSSCFFIVDSLMGHDLSCVDDVIEQSVAPEFIAAIATFRRDQRMQRYGCRVLRRLYTRARETSLHGPRIVLLGKNLGEVHTFRGLERIWTAMHTFEDDAVIQLESLTLLATLGELLYNNGMAEKTFQSIEIVMRRHSSIADIMSEGVLIISRLGESFLKIQKRGIHQVAMAMARHRSNRRMQRVGTQALFSLSKNSDTLELCRAGGGIAAVLLAMCAHSRDTQTTQMGTRVLEKLAPRALSHVFRVCGDVACVLPPVSWSTDPLVANVAQSFDLGSADEDAWSPDLLETFRSEMTGGAKRRPSAGSKSAPAVFMDGREGLADAQVYRRVGVAEDIDCTDVFWAVPGLPVSRDDGAPRHDVLKKDMLALKKAGCDQRILLSDGPTDKQLEQLVQILQEGHNFNTLGPQDAELLACLLGHFAWHSADRAKKIVECGGEKAFASWLSQPSYVKQGHNPQDDHLVFPMFRACLTALSCLCRHEDKANVQAVLKLDGIVDVALEFAGHLERDVKRSALRLLARLLPHAGIPMEQMWQLAFRHLRASGEDESVRAVAGACILQAATHRWGTQEPPRAEFASAVHSGLSQGLLGESAAVLPLLLAVEHVVSKEEDAVRELLYQHWLRGDLVSLLAAWLPRALLPKAFAADKAASFLAATAMDKLAVCGAVFKREDLEALLRHTSASESGQHLREACLSAVREAVGFENDAEMMAQIIACFVEETLAQGKRVTSHGMEGLTSVAKRMVHLLQGRDAELPAPDTLLQALRRARPHLEGAPDAEGLLQLLQEAHEIVGGLEWEPSSRGSDGFGLDGTSTRGSRRSPSGSRRLSRSLSRKLSRKKSSGGMLPPVR